MLWSGAEWEKRGDKLIIMKIGKEKEGKGGIKGKDAREMKERNVGTILIYSFIYKYFFWAWFVSLWEF